MSIELIIALLLVGILAFLMADLIDEIETAKRLKARREELEKELRAINER